MLNEEDIVKDIKALAEKYAKKLDRSEEIDKLKETIKHMISVVNTRLYEGKSLIAEYKETGLSISQIEAEGYVRACAYIKNDFYNWDDTIAMLIEENDKEWVEAEALSQE